MDNNIESAKKYLKSIGEDWLSSNSNLPDILVRYHTHTMEELEKQVSDEVIESKFPATYAQIVNIDREPLNPEYLKKYEIDFFENYLAQQGAKRIRSLIFKK